MSRWLVTLFALLTLLGSLGSCVPPSFDPASLVKGVRILAVRADQPYASPGNRVTLDVLAVDGRVQPTAPMKVYWLPQACINPAHDAYYDCFADFPRQFSQGVDLEASLVESSQFSFQMPSDAITAHAPSGGEPYGLAFAFSIACTGHVRYDPALAGGAPDGVPFGCFDDTGVRLGDSDFVFAYAQVYSFDERKNQNPVITRVTYGPDIVDPEAGLTLAHCTASKIDDCPATKFDVALSPDSQELNPGDLDGNGEPLKEQLYAAYFVSDGKLTDEVTILFDSREGRLANTGDEYRSPLTPGERQLWLVVHDNRGGVTWQSVPLHVN